MGRWWHVTWTAVVHADDVGAAGQEADEMRKRDGGRYRVRPVTDHEHERLGLARPSTSTQPEVS